MKNFKGNKSEAESYVTYHRPPTNSEINFGDGAIHYKDFPYEYVLNKKGKLKKYFYFKGVSGADGLRYTL